MNLKIKYIIFFLLVFWTIIIFIVVQLLTPNIETKQNIIIKSTTKSKLK